jgi:hypothetical protein
MESKSASSFNSFTTMQDKFDDLKVTRKNTTAKQHDSLSNKKKTPHQLSSSDQKSSLYNRQGEMKEIDDKLKSLEMLIKNNLF